MAGRGTDIKLGGDPEVLAAGPSRRTSAASPKGALAALGAGLEVAVEQTSHDLQISDTGVSYAVAIPVAVFLVLLWAVHTTISSVPALHPVAVLACTALVLLLPIATPWAGTVAIVAALTLSCVLLTAVTTAQRARD